VNNGLKLKVASEMREGRGKREGRDQNAESHRKKPTYSSISGLIFKQFV